MSNEKHFPINLPIIAPPICVDCKRLRPATYGKWGLFCDAFPDGIPEDIIKSRVDHRQPVDGDHGLQFLAKSKSAAADAAHIIDEAEDEENARPLLSDANLSNDWLYDWGDLPTTLSGLKAWLLEHDVSVDEFKNTARYEANYDRFPWLKDL